jgi:hypothetical protein
MSGNFQATCGKVQHGLDLFPRQAIVELHEFVDRHAVFQVFKNCGDGHAGTAKNPRAADFPGHTFDSGALRPIEHEYRAFLMP